MQEPVVPRKDARIPRTPSTNQIPAGRVQGRRGVLKNGSLDQSGLEGAGALRARSLARRETGHGARGRTRRARSPVRLTHAASPGRRLLRSPDRTLQSPDSREQFANTHALRGRLSPQSRLPPGVLGDAPHRGLPRGHAGKTKGQWGRPGRQEYPLVTTLAEEIQEAKLKTRAPARTERWLQVSWSQGVERPSWRCPHSGSCRGVLGGGEMAVGPVGSVTPRRAQEAAEWQHRVRACVSPSRLPDTAQFRSRHLMAKVEGTRAGSEAGAAPWLPLDRDPQVGSSQSAATFPRLWIPSATAAVGVLPPT